MPVKIVLKEGEPIDKALRRLRKQVTQDGITKDYKKSQRFEKKSDKKRRKKREAIRKMKQNNKKRGQY